MAVMGQTDTAKFTEQCVPYSRGRDHQWLVETMKKKTNEQIRIYELLQNDLLIIIQ